MKKHKKFASTVGIVLIGILISGELTPLKAAKFCLADAIVAMTSLYPNLVKKLSDKITAKAAQIASGRRWLHLPVNSRLTTAQAELLGSMAHADHIGGTKIGVLASDAYVETLALDRVLESAESLEDMGQGFGHLANRLPAANADNKLKDILEKNREVFNRRTDMYANYHEAHMLRDAKIVFDQETGALEAQNYVIQLASGGDGMAFELRVAAARKSTGEKLLALDADATGLNLTKLDLITDKGAYNIGLNTTTIQNKLLRNPTDARTMAQAVIDAERDLGVPYKFVCSTGNPSDVAAAFQALNTELQNLGSSRRFNVNVDLIVEPLR